MEGARDNFFSGAMLAGNKDVGVGGSDAGNGIENRLHYHEIPLPAEGAWLFADYAPELVGYWHDVGHAEVQARLGYVDKRAWLDALGPRMFALTLEGLQTGIPGDGVGGRGHRFNGSCRLFVQENRQRRQAPRCWAKA